MKDLIVNFIGAVVFSVIGYFYIKNRGKGRFAKRFIPRLKSKDCLLYTSEGEDGNLSREGEAFLAGICEHIDGITAILNPLVNSYKRLVPGFAAPSNVDWSKTVSYTHLRIGDIKLQMCAVFNGFP